MYLKDLIAALAAFDPATPVRYGFARPHSYRGYYEELAFEIERDTTVGAMLACARGALGATYEGYKGGDFTMGEWTRVWLVRAEGESEGDLLGPVLVAYMTGRFDWLESRLAP